MYKYLSTYYLVLHEPYLDIDYDDLESCNFLDSDSDNDNEEFSMLNQEMIGYEEESHENGNGGAVLSKSVIGTQLPNEVFYNMWCQLNENQRHLFNVIFMMYHSMMSRFAEDNKMDPIEPYHIFLSGAAGVGKNFLM